MKIKKEKRENLVDFLINAGRLKRKKRKGWTILHQIKNSESTADHTFRVALLAWTLGEKRGLNVKKLVKMALIHDLCEVYAEDETPYDPILPKDRNIKKIKEIIKKRSRVQYSQKERERKIKRKFEKEEKGLNKLIAKLSPSLKREIKNLWLDMEKGLSKEGRFLKQIDKMENLLQALEYWKEQGQIQRDLWIISAREWCTDPLLIDFLNELDKKFSRKKSKKS
jgi:putative hydrolase of HD superfamily